MRRAKSLSEVWIHFERQKIDNKYMAKCKYCQTNFIRETRKKKTVFLSWWFSSEKKKRFFSTGKKTFTSLTGTEEKVAASPLQPHQRVDQHTGDRHANPPCKGAEPRRGSSPGTKKKTRGEQYNCDKTNPQPQARPSPQE